MGNWRPQNVPREAQQGLMCWGCGQQGHMRRNCKEQGYYNNPNPNNPGPNPSNPRYQSGGRTGSYEFRPSPRGMGQYTGGGIATHTAPQGEPNGGSGCGCGGASTKHSPYPRPSSDARAFKLPGPHLELEGGNIEWERIGQTDPTIIGWVKEPFPRVNRFLEVVREEEGPIFLHISI